MADLQVAGRRVAYSEAGSGVPIVFLHAGAGSGRQWAKTPLTHPAFIAAAIERHVNRLV